MTEGNLWSGILRFSVPLMFSNVLQVLFNMSDVAVVGRFAGSAALGSVGSTTILISVFTGFLIGIGSGINALVARFYGARQHDEVKKSIGNSLVFALGTSLFLMLAGLIFAHPLLKLLNTKEELIGGALLYLRICFLGMPAMGLFNFGSGVLSAVGETKKPVLILTMSGILNVLLNLLFVIVFNMSVAGVALATIISQYLSAVLILVLLIRSRDTYALSFKKENFRIDLAKQKALFALGIPAGFQNAIFGIANLFIQSAVNSFPAVVVEGNSAAANADTLVYTLMATFYVAATSFIAQNWGANHKKRVLQSYLICILYAFATGAVLGLLLVLFGRQFLSLFTTEKEVIDAGMVRLVIMGLSYGISSPMDTSTSAARGLGKTLVPTIIIILGSCVFRVAWIYTVFAYFKTIPSIYLLYCFSWILTAAAECIYFAKIYKRTFA